MAKRDFTIEVATIYDETTGEEFIVPSEGDIAEIASGLDYEAGEIEELKKGVKSKERQANIKFRTQQLELNRESLEKVREMRKRLIDLATRTQFRVRRISYGEYLEAEDEAKTVNPTTGDVTRNQTILIKELMPKALPNLTDEDIDDLSPNVAAYLWNKIYRTIFPDERRLPFLSAPSRTSNGG